MTKVAIEKNVPLAPLTTLELGGPARHFAQPQTGEALLDALRFAADRMVEVAILAGGSNTIVPDQGFRGLVIHPAMRGLAMEPDPARAGRTLLRVAAGEPWPDVVEAAVSRGLAGVECLAGIPGSTGAVPVQNVGAYGQEVSDTIAWVRALDRSTLEEVVLTPEECEFAYRDSRLKREPHRYLITEVAFSLLPGGPPSVRYAELERAVASEVGAAPTVRQVADLVVALRRKKSMVLDPADPNRRSAGSFFTNPIVAVEQAEALAERAAREGIVASPAEVPRWPQPEGRQKLAAGWLIERAGIAKGTRKGAVGISTAHALALVHHGGGTTAELLAFAEEVATRVNDRFGVTLEREPRILEGVVA